MLGRFGKSFIIFTQCPHGAWFYKFFIQAAPLAPCSKFWDNPPPFPFLTFSTLPALSFFSIFARFGKSFFTQCAPTELNFAQKMHPAHSFFPVSASIFIQLIKSTVDENLQPYCLCFILLEREKEQGSNCFRDMGAFPPLLVDLTPYRALSQWLSIHWYDIILCSSNVALVGFVVSTSSIPIRYWRIPSVGLCLFWPVHVNLVPSKEPKAIQQQTGNLVTTAHRDKTNGDPP